MTPKGLKIAPRDEKIIGSVQKQGPKRRRKKDWHSFKVFISPTLERKTLMLIRPSFIYTVLINPGIFICFIILVIGDY